LNAISAIQRANWNVVLADMALNAAYADYLSVTTREAELDRLKTSTSATISAWCADYTEDLTGTVATMEVPGEVNPLIGGGINIRPGYFDDAAWSADLWPVTARDHAVRSRLCLELHDAATVDEMAAVLALWDGDRQG
jgi:hypothetical protein